MHVHDGRVDLEHGAREQRADKERQALKAVSRGRLRAHRGFEPAVLGHIGAKAVLGVAEAPADDGRGGI